MSVAILWLPNLGGPSSQRPTGAAFSRGLDLSVPCLAMMYNGAID